MLHFLNGPATFVTFFDVTFNARRFEQFVRRIQDFGLPLPYDCGYRGGDVLDAAEEEEGPAGLTFRERPGLLELFGLAANWLPGRTARI